MQLRETRRKAGMERKKRGVKARRSSTTGISADGIGGDIGRRFSKIGTIRRIDASRSPGEKATGDVCYS